MAVSLLELTELVLVRSEEMFEELTMTGKAKNKARFVEEEKKTVKRLRRSRSYSLMSVYTPPLISQFILTEE